jgi:basic membrane protein A
MVTSNPSRRRFLASVKNAAVGGVLAGALAGAAGTYLATGGAKTTTVEKTVTVETKKSIKAGYIYIGPAKDYGWSYSHDQGRQWADRRMPSAKSTYIEGVSDADAKSAMRGLIEGENVD